MGAKGIKSMVTTLRIPQSKQKQILQHGLIEHERYCANKNQAFQGG